MKRVALLAATLLASSALLTFTAGLAMAHGGKEVAVQPPTARPGETITVKGEGLGESRDIEIRIVGTGVNIDLGEFEANAEGEFSAEVTVPTDLKAGTYQVKAIGQESETAELTLLAAGSSAAAAAPMQEATPVQERPLLVTLGFVILFGLLSGLGLFFARSARKDKTAQREAVAH